MRARELIQHLRLLSDPYSRDASTMLERFLALADELEFQADELDAEDVSVGQSIGLLKAAKRIREIAEQND